MTRREKRMGIFIILLALTGLAAVVIPNGMRFTGWLCLGTAAVWTRGILVVRWGRRSRAGRICLGPCGSGGD